MKDYAIKGLRKMSILGAIGGTIFDYFIDKGIATVDVYGNDAIVAALYEQAFWKNIKIRQIYSDTVQEYELNFMEKSKLKKIKTTPMDSNNKTIPLIVCEPLKLSQKNAYKIGDLISYSFIKHTLFDKIVDYKNKYCPSLKVIMLCLPSLYYVKNKTPYELSLLQGNLYDKERETAVYAQLGKSAEYIEEVRKNIEMVENEHGIYAFVDKEGEYLSSIGGHRLTTDTPQKVSRRIYTFGASLGFGMRTDDAHTIQSVCQRRLNEHFNNQSPYAILNCGVGGFPNLLKQRKSFEYHKPQDGDVAIFIDWYNKLLRENYSEPFYWCNPQGTSRLFDRPHELGDYIWIDRLHYSHIGYRELGTYLGNYLIENGIVNKENKDFTHCVNETVSKPIVVQSSQQTSSPPPELVQYLQTTKQLAPRIGSIVMNCNPFTLGHRYLISESAKKVSQLIIFVVQEDKSVFPFQDRLELVRKGTADLPNVTVVPSGGFIISQTTFGAYFEKDSQNDIQIDPSMDIEIFAQHIAPALGITVRFAGEEPLDMITRQYNDTMARILPRYGIDFDVIARKDFGGEVISASRVRKLLETKDFDSIGNIVPETTLAYLKEKYGGDNFTQKQTDFFGSPETWAKSTLTPTNDMVLSLIYTSKTAKPGKLVSENRVAQKIWLHELLDDNDIPYYVVLTGKPVRSKKKFYKEKLATVQLVYVEEANASKARALIKQYRKAPAALEELIDTFHGDTAMPLKDGVPQVVCGACGEQIDFDYPKCPFCKAAVG